jgi:protein phosphatase
MGGYKGGEEASSIAGTLAMNSIEENLNSFKKYSDNQKLNFLKNTIVKINKEVYKKSKDDPSLSGMGTTLVMCVIYNNTYYVANVGDSRFYIISDEITQITKDHSFVNELLDMGAITLEQAKNHPNKNVITRAIGTEPGVEADVYTGEITPSDTVLICTDGLSNMVDDKTIADIVKESCEPKIITEKLVNLAKENGGTDNITAVIIKTTDGGDNL